MVQHTITDGMDDRHVNYQATCIWCGKQSVLENISKEAYYRWQAGTFVQDAFPGMTPGDREILVSGTHDACFNQMFPEGVDY